MNGRGVPGTAIDVTRDRRPGVPKENLPPRPVDGAHWTEPERQPDPGHVLKRKDLPELTPVFGTSVPPRGLSGVLRRAAYRIAEHRASHWLLLLFADRVDALEHGARRAIPISLALAGGGLVGLRIVKRARRFRFRR